MTLKDWTRWTLTTQPIQIFGGPSPILARRQWHPPFWRRATWPSRASVASRRLAYRTSQGSRKTGSAISASKLIAIIEFSQRLSFASVLSVAVAPSGGGEGGSHHSDVARAERPAKRSYHLMRGNRTALMIDLHHHPNPSSFLFATTFSPAPKSFGFLK